MEWSNGVVPRRLTPAPVAEVTAALERHRADPGGREDLRLLTKHFLALLQQRAPGNSAPATSPGTPPAPTAGSAPPASAPT